MRVTLAQKFAILLIVVGLVPLVLFLGFSTIVFPELTQTSINESSEILESDVKDSLRRLVEEKAATNNRYFEKITNYTNFFAQFTEAIWENRSHFGAPGLYFSNITALGINFTDLGLTNQDVFGYSIAAGVPLNTTINQTLEYSSLLGRIFKPTFQTDPTISWAYLGSKYGTFMVFPYSEVPDGYDCRSRIWYQNAVSSTINPTGTVIFTDPYVDAGGAGLVITAAIPAYNGTKTAENFIGVVGVDVGINYINQTVIAALPYNNSYSFVINGQGHVMARPDYNPGDLQWDESFEVEDLTQSSDPQIQAIAQKMILGETGITEIVTQNETRFIAYAPIDAIGWSFASVVSKADAMQAIETANTAIAQTFQFGQISITLLIIVSAVGITIVTLGISILISRPLARLSEIAQMLSRGQVETEVPFTDRNDEIGDLASSFKRMTASLKYMLEEKSEG